MLLNKLRIPTEEPRRKVGNRRFQRIQVDKTREMRRIKKERERQSEREMMCQSRVVICRCRRRLREEFKNESPLIFCI